MIRLGYINGEKVKYNVPKVIKIPFGHETSETDTGVDLPPKALVLDAFIEVLTGDSGITLDVGTKSSETGGDADGFLDGISVASTGLVPAGVTVTAGANENYFSACTYGAKLASFVAGSDTAGDVGTYARKYYATDSATAKSITYTASAGADTAEGNIYLLILELE